ncbi:DUF397 domain-containing protein [Actinomadura keratinilytica]|jgi:hypothetical protein|uniref:DUF397 domain-containing protein n=1 Tax=Actinomadura keratinilytica TaxID=547461 RepID=A0ABP7YRV2_9ACTN
MNRHAPVWRKSSYSGEESSSTCVEVAVLEATIGVRDSKDPDGPHLRLTRSAFAALLSEIKSGDR